MGSIQTSLCHGPYASNHEGDHYASLVPAYHSEAGANGWSQEVRRCRALLRQPSRRLTFISDLWQISRTLSVREGLLLLCVRCMRHEYTDARSNNEREELQRCMSAVIPPVAFAEVADLRLGEVVDMRRAESAVALGCA